MKSIFKIVANKYFIATIVFLVMVFFFSPYDFFSMREANQELEQLEEKISYLNQESDRMNQLQDDLKNDTATLERFARELYKQKRESEDVYVIK